MNVEISSREYYWQDITGGEALSVFRGSDV